MLGNLLPHQLSLFFLCLCLISHVFFCLCFFLFFLLHFLFFFFFLLSFSLIFLTFLFFSLSLLFFSVSFLPPPPCFLNRLFVGIVADAHFDGLSPDITLVPMTISYDKVFVVVVVVSPVLFLWMSKELFFFS